MEAKRLNVLHVHGDLIAGGGQTLSREWLRVLDRSKASGHVVVLNKPVTLQESFERAGIPVTQLFGSRPVQIFKLAKYIVKNNIDVVHTQSEPDRKVGHWAALLTRKPVIAHLHSEWVYFAEPSPSESILGKIKTKVAFTLRRISERSVTNLIATSDIVKEAFEQHTDKPITTIEPGVSITDITPEKKKKYREALGVKDNETLIVNLSRLDKVKNLKDFILVIAEISKKRKVKAFVAGEGPLRENLIELVNEKNLNDCIEILHAVDEPLDLLGAADIFLATSTYESFGISVLESLSVGVPVVGYELEVYNRYNGAVISSPMGDITSLSNNLELLIDDPEMVKLKRQQSILAAKPYDIKFGADELLKIDQEVCGLKNYIEQREEVQV